MNHLIVKTKGRDGQFYKLISEKTFFSTPDNLSNATEYTPTYKLEEDEIYSVKNFSEKNYCIEFLRQKFNSTEYNQLPYSLYSQIEFLCAVQSGKYFFQKITPSQIIAQKWISLSRTPKLVEDEKIIVMNRSPDAVYLKANDTLYFTRLPAIATIFKGIESLYREATNAETERFLHSDFISVQNGYGVNSVKTANRKRIALVLDTLNRFRPKERKEIFKYIRDYCGNIKCKKDSFVIEKEDDLKQVLYGIEQRYYTTPLGNEKRLANSIIKLS